MDYHRNLIGLLDPKNLILKSYKLLEGRTRGNRVNHQESLPRAHVLVAHAGKGHCYEISYSFASSKSTHAEYSSWPAVSRMSSKHVSESIVTCFR